MRARRNMRWLAVFACVFALIGAACGDDTEPTDGDTESPVEEFPAGTTMADLQEAGKITIGVKFDVPPFGFKNPETDEVEGFDVDLGQAIADALGVEPEFIEAISDNRIPFLTDGTADLILSTMTITTDRDAEIDFSIPYYVAEGRVLVPADSDITGVEDLAGTTVTRPASTSPITRWTSSWKRTAPGSGRTSRSSRRRPDIRSTGMTVRPRRSEPRGSGS